MNRKENLALLLLLLVLMATVLLLPGLSSHLVQQHEQVISTTKEPIPEYINYAEDDL